MKNSDEVINNLLADASNPNIKEERFNELFKKNNWDIDCKLVLNPKCPSYILKRIAERYTDKYNAIKPWISFYIIQNPNCPLDFIGEYYLNFSEEQRNVGNANQDNFIDALNRILNALDNPYIPKKTLNDLQMLPFDHFYADKMSPRLIEELKNLERKVKRKAKRLLRDQNRKFHKMDKSQLEVYNEKMSDLYEKGKEEVKKQEDVERIYKELEENLKKIVELSQQLHEASGSEKSLYHSVKIPRDILLKQVDDHLEIKDTLVPFIKYIDLSEAGILESKLKVSGIDFTDTNIILLPQRVYKKDLSYSKFGDENLFGDFSDVDLRGTDISNETNGYGFENAIIDENTKLPMKDKKINKLL